jgi:peptidoglycan/LPS O-acetylase OafA/YrhL
MKSGHIPALDGIRGLAVVRVLIFHFAKVAPRNAILDPAGSESTSSLP